MTPGAEISYDPVARYRAQGRGQGLVDFCQVLVRLNEFVTWIDHNLKTANGSRCDNAQILLGVFSTKRRG